MIAVTVICDANHKPLDVELSSQENHTEATGQLPLLRWKQNRGEVLGAVAERVAASRTLQRGSRSQ